MNEERHSPQEQPGKLASLTLTIVVHVGLALFLFFGLTMIVGCLIYLFSQDRTD